MDGLAVITEWIAFAGVMALGQFSPGPDMLLLTRTALARGWRAGCATALGIAAGLGIHAFVALFGVSALLLQGSWLVRGMSAAAGIYLVWLGWQLFCEAWSGVGVNFSEGEVSEKVSFWPSWRRGFFCNILNPKVAVFLAGVVMPFLKMGESEGWAVVLWLTIVLEGMLLWCLWACVLQIKGVKAGYKRASRVIDALFGLILWALAGVLLYSMLPHAQ